MLDLKNSNPSDVYAFSFDKLEELIKNLGSIEASNEQLSVLGKVDFILSAEKFVIESEKLFMNLITTFKETKEAIDDNLSNMIEEMDQFVPRLFESKKDKMLLTEFRSYLILAKKDKYLFNIDNSKYLTIIEKIGIIDSLYGDYFKKGLEALNLQKKAISEYVGFYEDVNTSIEDVIKKFHNENLLDETNKEINNTIIKISDLDIYIYFKWRIYILYIADITSLMDVACFKYKKLKKDFTQEEYVQIVGKTIKKFNKYFLKNIEDIFEFQEKYFESDIIISIFFDELKNNGMGIDDLSNIDLKEENINTIGLSKKGKEDILSKMMSLYKNSYKGEKRFLKDIKLDLNSKIENDNTNVSFIELDGKKVAGFYNVINDDHIYLGGLNIGKGYEYYSIGFWYAEEKVKELGVNNNLECIVTNEIDGKINSNYRILLRKYKSLGFIEYGEGKTKNSKYIKLRREKGDFKNNSVNPS